MILSELMLAELHYLSNRSGLGHQIAIKRELNKRKFEADVSESVMSLLHVSKILQMRKSA